MTREQWAKVDAALTGAIRMMQGRYSDWEVDADSCEADLREAQALLEEARHYTMGAREVGIGCHIAFWGGVAMVLVALAASCVALWRWV